MNKITFLSFGYWQSVCIAVLLSIAATVMLASCSDDDTSGGTAPDDGNAIRFTTAIASLQAVMPSKTPAHAPLSTTRMVRAASPTATKRRLWDSSMKRCRGQKRIPRHLQGRNVDYHHDMG